MKTFWLIILFFPLQIYAQITVNGRVTDAGTLQPVPYVTIYVNGTTIGTISNNFGQFTLEKVIPPSEIVFSHISYETVVISFDQSSETSIDVALKPRFVILDDVKIIDRNLRDANLLHFKEHFLGTDYWGKRAKIENDSVLVFHLEKVSESEGGGFESGFYTADRNSTLFVVNTKGPLLVSLPLLGYKLHINLIRYTELQTVNDADYEFHTLGYFYFQPEENTSKRETMKLEKNRREVWYNSDRHFCSSLFSDRLKENGYLVSTDDLFLVFHGYNTSSNIIDPETGEAEKNEFEFDNHIIRKGAVAKIVGLKNKNYYIKYFEKYNAPMNLIKEVGLAPKLSKIYFLKDTCIIRADGSRPDNSIMFGQEISNKRVGAMLPYDFKPEIQY